ncbi:hypothetical protein ACFL6M_01925 [Candidatus Eisenbacteria bacterium]|uniref:Uncharacterized protein n=1 Tax=Eiseniibacteriota bacterium TaxID=2212470 RepID=A0ABV6YJH8_UNCEI
MHTEPKTTAKETQALAQELLGRQLADEVGSRVEAQLRKRYAWLGVAVALLTGGLGTLIVKTSIGDAVATIKVQEKLQERFTKQLDTVEDAVRRSDELVDRLKDLEGRIQEAEGKESKLNIRLSNASTEALGVSGDLQAQINGLRVAIEELADQVDKPIDLLAVADKSDLTSMKITAAADRAEKRQFPISFALASGSGEEAVEVVREAGFDVDLTFVDKDAGKPAFFHTLQIPEGLPPQFVAELLEAIGSSNGPPVTHIVLEPHSRTVGTRWLPVGHAIDIDEIRTMKTPEDLEAWLSAQ